MNPPILVTGGTGTLGRLITPLLREAGHPVWVLSRRGGQSAPGIEQVTADLATGDGVDAAVRGAGIVLHLAGGQKGDNQIARTLTRAVQRAGDVRHLVFISVIGADRVPLAWLRTKLTAEETISGSGVPWTILRAAQFHELVLTMAQKMAALPVVPVPGMRLQPVDGREVAARLAALTLGAPAGLVPDLAGPKVYPMGDLIHGYLRATGKRRLMLPVRLPGRAGRAYRDGANLTLDGATGTRTWEAFLAERLGHPARPR
ncbi:NmrA family transcriptional regulator [Micromonospora craterilacus]|uniref:NmrA family transcriptional regulator n=1 Tax=Micromonospora craterilacus TaxID=1655439 RepID=A0A2W2ENM6_9ACTN|nr:SDR family oxidoreductase [Micromonospora craterilacus]PZG18359.1 NmrA family transcriptional regulator [Micromonospora craterilacus]